jgi:hypothetical protein
MTDPKPPLPLRSQLGPPWRRTILILNELAAHLTVIFGLLAAIKLGQWVLFYFASTGGELIFFKGSEYQFNAQWFFDAADLALLVALLLLGVGLTIWTAVRGEHK